MALALPMVAKMFSWRFLLGAKTAQGTSIQRGCVDRCLLPAAFQIGVRPVLMPVEVPLTGDGTGAHQQRCGSQSESKQALHGDGAFAQRVWGMTLGCMGECPLSGKHQDHAYRQTSDVNHDRLAVVRWVCQQRSDWVRFALAPPDQH